MNIENNFVPYNIALELKKLGFDEPCLKQGNPHGHTMWRFGCTDDENDTLTIKDIISQKLHEDFIGIPLYQSVQNWLLKKHDIWVTAVANIQLNLWKPVLLRYNKDDIYDEYAFDTPQEALNSGFEYCLKNLIK